MNLLLGLAMAGGLLLWSNPEVVAYFISPTPTPSATPTPTASPSPTVTPSETSTPTSTETPAPSETATTTPTPVPFSEGPFAIGSSVQGRPLQVWRFGTGQIERLIVAGIHGGSEYNTIQLADELMAHLGDHPEIIPPDVTLYILRSLNPDGEARARNYLGRANANGVDLNRNWDAHWQADWPRAGCWTNTYVTGGPRPGSEPETQVLMAFIQAHRIDAIINYHSAALGIFPGGWPPLEDSVRLAEAVDAVTTYPYPPIDTGCVYTGGFVDWAAVQDIAALDLELTNHTDTDFEMNLGVLNIFLSWRR
jgi:hypothetical protein